MWSELDLEQMAREENARAGVRSKEEVEEIVIMERLHLYNHGQPCGPKALHQRLDQHYSLKPLPSERNFRCYTMKPNTTN